jgi:HEPN domain-containing protein
MSAERFPPGDPREWLRLARGDAAIAHAEIRDAPLELLCFHAQQAAEKAIKAVLLAERVDLPRTHNLQLLIDLLDEQAFRVSGAVREAAPLTLYAVLTRYPCRRDRCLPKNSPWRLSEQMPSSRGPKARSTLRRPALRAHPH